MDKFLRKRKIFRGAEIEDSIMTVTEGEEAVIETPFQRLALDRLWYLVVLAILLLAARVFYLDFIRGSYYEELARGNRIRSIVMKAPRGEIFDKFGTILARNVPSVDAIVIPSDLPEDELNREKEAEVSANILGIEKGNVQILLESQDRKSMDPILLKENISQDEALILSEKAKELPGITIEKTAIRNYDDSSIFSSVIGYDGKITRDELNKNPGYLMTDYIGKSGIEKSYEKELRGANGARQVEVDSMGNTKKNLGIVESQAGNALVLNIDAELQKKIYDSLTSILEKTGTHVASAIAIDPRNGGILAMVNLPGYDNNLFARGITNDEYQSLINNKNLPLINRAIGGEYPPGSTFKPLVASAALTEGTITPETTVTDNSGVINIGAWHFGDWKTHGVVDVRKAIAESCDVFFYAVGGGYANIPGLGMDRIKKYADLFGLGQETGIDLPGEANGFIPNEQWKSDKLGEKWYIGDSYHAAIGQGFVTATPLQLVNYVAAIANGGTLYEPRVVNSIKKNDGENQYLLGNVIRKDFISKNVLQVVREGMRQTIESGTAQPLKDLPVAVAGKTGTAQFGSEGKTHGWFVSFAPYDNPEIAMIVLAEGGGEGHSSGVPVTREVYDWYFSRGKR